MRTAFRKAAVAAAAAVTIAGATAALSGAAYAQHWHVGWHGGHGGFGWGGFALGLGTGLALGAPYYGGPYAYAGGCVMRRRLVHDGYGHRVWRWARVCY